MKHTNHDISELKLDIINATGINPGKRFSLKTGFRMCIGWIYTGNSDYPNNMQRNLYQNLQRRNTSFT